MANSEAFTAARIQGAAPIGRELGLSWRGRALGLLAAGADPWTNTTF